MAAFFGLARRSRHERAGFSLYTAAVAAAREPYFYLSLGVADTLDGRFDLVCLHVFLLVRRLQREADPGPAQAQAVFDAMFSDMDDSLREMGVGDLSVGRRMRAMWEAFNGRAHAYEAALTDPAALEAALVRNVWRGIAPADGCAAALARLVTAQAAYLDGQEFAALAGGTAAFLPAAATLRAADPLHGTEPHRGAEPHREAEPHCGAEPDSGVEPNSGAEPDSGPEHYSLAGPPRVDGPGSGADCSQPATGPQP